MASALESFPPEMPQTCRVGSLTSYNAGVGYWTIVSDDLSFSFETGSMARSDIRRYVETRPSGSAFMVAQSPNQAFYFVDTITLDESVIEDGDWLLSYNGNVLTGIRQWQGVMIDIPAMGIGENSKTDNYFIDGDILQCLNAWEEIKLYMPFRW